MQYSEKLASLAQKLPVMGRGPTDCKFLLGINLQSLAFPVNRPARFILKHKNNNPMTLYFKKYVMSLLWTSTLDTKFMSKETIKVTLTCKLISTSFSSRKILTLVSFLLGSCWKLYWQFRVKKSILCVYLGWCWLLCQWEPYWRFCELSRSGGRATVRNGC